MFRAFFLSFCLITSLFATKNIFVLLSYPNFLPWAIDYYEGLKRAKEIYDLDIELYIENMDSVRLKDCSLSDDEWVLYLKNKYKNIKIDGLVSESSRANLFLLEYGFDIFGDIPFTYVSDSPISDSNITKLSKTKDLFSVDYIDKTLKLIEVLQPTLEEIFVINQGDSLDSNMMTDLIESRKLNVDIKFRIFKNFTIGELKDELSKLDSKTAVIYTVFFEDRAKNKFIPKEILKELSRSSIAPIYTFYSPLKDTGVIGGYMVDGKLTAINSIKSIMDILDKNSTYSNYSTSKLILNWNVLNKFRIDKNSIPIGAEIINREHSIFDKYFFEISVLIFFIFVLTLMLVLNIYLNINRKKLIISLIENNRKLELETNERIKNEKLLIQQSKMASMGEMIGAIAHQWKQPLNTLNLVSYSIEDSIEAQSFDRDEFMDYCKIIQDNITYMSDTINDFRNFFKQQKNKEIFPVSKSVEKIQKILHSQLTNNGIKLTFDSCNITIYAVSNELEQVFINIINNAKDTFIERNIENRELKISCVRFENQLIIKIEDNAGGIPPNIIDKIFEPYFTTKSAQDGDGLGLYMSRLIIENSMLGEINVYNSTLGAVFEIKLPILDL